MIELVSRKGFGSIEIVIKDGLVLTVAPTYKVRREP